MPLFYKRPLSKDICRSNIRYVGEKSKKVFLYKYLTVSSLYASLKNISLRFSQPSQWKDKYERLYYTADYDTCLQAPADTHPWLYACCVTTEGDCEASWRMYGTLDEPLCVRLKLNKKKFFDALQKSGSGCKFYIGQVNYDLTDYRIRILGHPTYRRKVKNQTVFYPTPGYKALFDKFDLCSYLNLLLFKRKAFSYEQELRIFAIPRTDEEMQEYKDVKLNWADFIEGIHCPDKSTELAVRQMQAEKLLHDKIEIITYDVEACPVIGKVLGK